MRGPQDRSPGIISVGVCGIIQEEEGQGKNVPQGGAADEEKSRKVTGRER